MKKTLLSLVVIAAIVIGLLQMQSVQNLLVNYSLPDFPDWPAPQTALAAGDNGTIYFQTASPFDLDVIFNGMQGATPTTGLGYLSMPAAVSPEQPVPAMILLHGSGGISEGREPAYAKWLNSQGIAAFVVDYYQPRGITEDTNYLIKVSAVTEFDVITDAYAALQLLATSPLIDPRRIGLIGFSYGGMATRFAMDERFRRQLAPEHPGFALHADIYGPCFQNLETSQTNGAPLLTLRGTEDKSNDLAACKQREDELRALNVAVESHIYAGAGHAWENLADRAPKEDAPYIVGCELTYTEQGLARLNGQAFNDTPKNASRSERTALRLTSGAQFQQCLQYGYIIGHDQASKDRGYQDIQAFLEQRFKLAENAPQQGTNPGGELSTNSL